MRVRGWATAALLITTCKTPDRVSLKWLTKIKRRAHVDRDAKRDDIPGRSADGGTGAEVERDDLDVDFGGGEGFEDVRDCFASSNYRVTPRRKTKESQFANQSRNHRWRTYLSLDRLATMIVLA